MGESEGALGFAVCLAGVVGLVGTDDSPVGDAPCFGVVVGVVPDETLDRAPVALVAGPVRLVGVDSWFAIGEVDQDATVIRWSPLVDLVERGDMKPTM